MPGSLCKQLYLACFIFNRQCVAEERCVFPSATTCGIEVESTICESSEDVAFLNYWGTGAFNSSDGYLGGNAVNGCRYVV